MGQKDRGEIAQLPELRIIDEDDHHAVITVRIKKAWLAANLPFLAALADVATTPTILPIS